ncbi:MAG: MFS transporter [Nitrosomonadaceae bacterium]|nr:MFS transporter [Nitrosomonadaceae bacterium]MDW7652669.1 MFS transporter [Nitrosomonadaceae bacterium]MDW7664361.1 MFS transporter [Nitrosomonadaceae bacterium]MDW7665176.1 MFS transporter [Nitrosomonadaceae bacterium]
MYPLPYWRLSGFYFFHFALIGAFAPYWGLYLQSLSFSAFQIGLLMSLLQIIRIIAPTGWGWLADRIGKQILVVQLSAIAGLISYCGFFFENSFIWMFVIMALMSFFWSASLPLIEATTFSYLDHSSVKYGSIRSWGSLGFILAVIGTGHLLDNVNIAWLLWVILGFKLGIIIFSYQIPEIEAVPRSGDSLSIRQILLRPEVLVLFTACLLMAFAHAPYYTFYSIYLEEYGYSRSSIGWLWATGVICEIGIFFIIPRLLQRFSLKQILSMCFGCAVVRFLMIGWGVEYFLIVLLAQVLHAVTYGAYHATAITMVHHFFRGRHQAKGQALYVSLTFGVGGALGSIFSGYAWEGLGSGFTFSISAIAALLGFGLVAWRMILKE